MSRKSGPVDAVLAITYRCNLRCVTCDLGGRGDDRDLDPQVLRKLPRSLRYVNVTGGEPFLHPDLEACVLATAAATDAEITISTNGTLPGRVRDAARALAPRVPGLRVAISLDGGAATHDAIRRSPGAFAKAMETALGLRSLLGRRVHLAFTVSAANAHEVGAVASIAHKARLPLSLAFTHASSHYFHPQPTALPSPPAATAAAAAAARFYLRTFSAPAIARAYFAAGFAHLAQTGRRPLPCRAGDRFFYLDPGGDMYLCNMRDEKLGNLSREGFDAIWDGPPRAGLLPSTGDRCPLQCWMVCTARTSIQDHPWRVARWAVAAYARLLAGSDVVKTACP